MGCMALRQTKATLPCVSVPSSVVRSIIEMASLRPASLAEVLMLRLANAAARSSTITWSTLRFGAALDDDPLRLSARAGACILEDNACIGIVSMGRSHTGGQLKFVTAQDDSQFMVRRARPGEAAVIAWHRARMFQDMGQIPERLFEEFVAAS